MSTINWMDKKSLPDWIATVLLLCYLLSGLAIVNQYGLNWDDSAQRDIGVWNWEYLCHHNQQPLLQSNDKYHGPAFELLLIAVEKKLHITSEYDIYQMRHLMVCIFSGIVFGVFYLLCCLLFTDHWYALAGMAMMILSPRIYGESLYNPKDIVFMGALVLAFYTMLRLVLSPSYLAAITHGVVAAFALDVRLIGGIIGVFTMAHLIVAMSNKRYSWRQIWQYVIVYLVAFILAMLLLWPILIQAPMHHLHEAFKQLSNYTLWDGTILYMGHILKGSTLPWHYQWLWVAISTPEAYLILFLVGITFLTIRCKSGFWRDYQYLTLLMAVFTFLFPMVFRSVTKAIVYDGWRHFYFVYPFLLLLSVYGLQELVSILSKPSKIAVITLISLSFVWEAFSIVKYSPYQYSYFSTTSRYLCKPMNHWFEVDYWGVSFRSGLDYLYTRSDSGCTVAFQTAPGYMNLQALPEHKRNHFIATDPIHADYFLTTYRVGDLPDSTWVKVHSLYADEMEVLGIYKHR